MTPDEQQGPGHTFLTSRDSAAGREGIVGTDGGSAEQKGQGEGAGPAEGSVCCRVRYAEMISKRRRVSENGEA